MRIPFVLFKKRFKKWREGKVREKEEEEILVKKIKKEKSGWEIKYKGRMGEKRACACACAYRQREI